VSSADHWGDADPRGFFIVPRVAILIDGGFFLKRYPWCYGRRKSPQDVAKDMHTMAFKHLEEKRSETLHRILFYDCPPIEKKAHLPVSKKSIDFSKTAEAQFRKEFHDCLRSLRKVALRLGHLSDGHSWRFHPQTTKEHS
jgi:hypothetical protein